MKLYRFSPIQNQEQLFEAITHMHFASYKLCKQSFGKYLPNAGNVGVFMHYDDEYEQMTELRKQLTESSNNPDQKYFKLHQPIVILAKDDVPETTYNYIYIRKPDIYRAQIGDVDFYLEQSEYADLKQSLIDGKVINGARLFPRNDLDMIELYDADIDALGYVSTNTMTEKVKTKQSEETNL